MYTNPSTSPLYQPCLSSLQFHNSLSHFLIYLFYFVKPLRLTRDIFEIRYQLEPDIQLKTWDVQIKTAVIFFTDTVSCLQIFEDILHQVGKFSFLFENIWEFLSWMHVALANIFPDLLTLSWDILSCWKSPLIRLIDSLKY